MRLHEITPAIFGGLGLNGLPTTLGPSPMGREVLFLIDGFGIETIEKYGSVAPNLAAATFINSIETTFPTTTSTSLASLLTGAQPNEHGMLGYTVRIPYSDGRILNALKWDERVDPVIWQPKKTFFEIGAENGVQVTHVAAKRYKDSGFTRAVFRGANYRGANVTPDLVTEAVNALTNTPSFVYLYVNDLDVAGHVAGVGSENWLAALRSIDDLLGQLKEKLPTGARIWITGDHGMINAQEKIVIGRDNLLATELETIAGEPRFRHLYLKRPEVAKEVASLWESELGNRVSVFTRSEIIDEAIFGSPMPESFAERIGDLVVIVNDFSILIDPDREKLESAMVGHHGALTDLEKNVPLLLV
ncbi:MAG: hypothetical protein RLZ57_1122 [Actinomycetota bacterium]